VLKIADQHVAFPKKLSNNKKYTKVLDIEVPISIISRKHCKKEKKNVDCDYGLSGVWSISLWTLCNKSRCGRLDA
jgi:hypothetical protein